jgi:hypothetical protein
MSSNVLALPDAKMTVKVVDEAGQAVKGAKVVIGFKKPSGKTFGGVVGNAQSDLSDENGLFTARGATEPFVGIGVSKEGYYRSSTEFNFKYKVSGMPGFRKWQPWDPTVEVVLKAIKEPIPLYAVNLAYINNYKSLRIPILGEFVGFDLVARDWVVPHGSGTRKDFLFKIDVHSVKSMFEYDATLTLKFANPDDGLLSVYDEPNKGSMLRLPHHAPISGYESELVLRTRRDKTRIYTPLPRDDQNYFFRVRSEPDEKGNIASALYGKIHGNFSYSFQPIDKPSEGVISFIYYLNPKFNDTNLEFNVENNLFTNLKKQEVIGLTP